VTPSWQFEALGFFRPIHRALRYEARVSAPRLSRTAIIECLSGAGRALHAREIRTRLGVAEDGYARLLELLDQLSLSGSVSRVGGNRFKADATPQRGAEWEGVLSMHPRGFGFVAAAGQDDVYVPPDAIGGALHGDRVRVRVVNKSARGIEGSIEAIVERRNPRVAGVLRRRARSAWLEPDDTRMRGPIAVVGLAGEGKDGDAAVVRITRFPSFVEENPEGELVAVLGVPGDPNAEVAKILVREQIVEDHPEGAVREAEAMAARLLRLSAENRTDLRDVPLPTIDPEDARDHDDAVWVERRDEGYRVWVAIADVSEYVTPGSELDAEALARGCTIYLPDRAIPMLPAALAADLCSLLPEQERLCMCVVAELGREGDVKGFEIVEGIMRSAGMLTYAGVARALGFTEQGPRSAQAEALRRDLKVIDELTRKLRRRRLKRGALDLDLPEARVVLDPDTGRPLDVVRRAQDPGVRRAYSMVEELMLLANELVAVWLSKRRCPAIYRVHGTPDAEKLERLGEAAKRLGVRVDLGGLMEPGGVSKWLAQISQHPKRAVLETLLLRSLKQAVYDIVNIGHFGLASDNYLHFTSPIRRYPDLQVHRAVKRLLHGERPDTSASGIEALRASATAASVRERAALDVEREVVDLYRTLLMRDRVGDEHEGNVTAFVGSGAYVTLDQPFVDVLVRYEAMGDDRYQLDSDELGVVGAKSGDRIALGDRIRVAIEDVAVLRRTVYARRLTVGGAAAAGGRRSAPKKRARAPVSHEKKPRGRTAPPGKRQTDRGRRQRG
jgi:ribonuclease R